MCCHCITYSLEQARILNYNNSNAIFLGIANRDKAGNFYMKVIEKFKGDFPDSILINESLNNGADCNILPPEGRLWLIYTNYQQGQPIYISSCSLSRGFDYPYMVHCYKIPPPPLIAFDTLNIKIEHNEIKILALGDLIEEIYILRSKKKINDIYISDKSKNNINYTISIALSLFAVLISFLGYVRSKKNFNK